MIGQSASEEKIFEMVDDDGRRTDDGLWPSYKLTLDSSELKLIATWYSLTPDPARSWGGACWHQCFVFEQDILIPVELVSTQEAAAPS